jgi:hypothetical protein
LVARIAAMTSASSTIVNNVVCHALHFTGGKL